MVTVITKTIGAGGGYDYATFTAAEADVENVATTAFGSTDLVANDGAIVFEAAAGTYNESVTFQSTLTTDATRQVTYKPAGGSEHGGVFDSGVILNGTTSTPATRVADDFMCLDGLQINDNNNDGSLFPVWSGANCALKNSLGVVGESDTSWGIIWSQESGSSPVVVENCVFKIVDGLYALGVRIASYVADTKMVVTNSTFIGAAASGAAIFTQNSSPGTTATLEATNCLNLTSGGSYLLFGTPVGTITVTGSNNFGGSTNPFPPALRGTPYPITATTNVNPGAGDWAIYDATNGALIDDPDNDVLAGGVGPSANSDVPTTDIVGNTRSGATTDPGAFEISTLTPPAPALITIMRQIYQQDASFSVGASSAGVEKITHQLGPASADYFTINSTTSATVSVPRTAHALRVICVVAAKACDVTLDLDASNSVFLGSIGGVASVQTDLTYFWSFGQVVSDGTYPRVRIVNDGFAGDQLVYLWWHLA